MFCYSLRDDPDSQSVETEAHERSFYECMLAKRETMMIRTLHIQAQDMRYTHLNIPRSRCVSLGLTTTHAFVAIFRGRWVRLAALTLSDYERHDTPFQAVVLERRGYRSPWRMFDGFSVAPRQQQVMAVACFRDLVCLWMAKRLVVLRHYEHQWSVVGDHEMPYQYTQNNIVAVPTVAMNAQCVLFAYRHIVQGKSTLSVYALTLKSIAAGKGALVPCKFELPEEWPYDVRLTLPEQVYNPNVVYGMLTDTRGMSRILMVRLRADNSNEKLGITSTHAKPHVLLWPAEAVAEYGQWREDMVWIEHGIVCRYSRALGKLLFHTVNNPDDCVLRDVQGEVVSVEIFQEYALVQYSNNEMVMMNLRERFRVYARLLQAVTSEIRQVASFKMEQRDIPGFPVATMYPRSTRTFANALFTMQSNGTLCRFRCKDTSVVAASSSSSSSSSSE